MKLNPGAVIGTYMTKNGGVGCTNSCPYLRTICGEGCGKASRDRCECRCCGSARDVCINFTTGHMMLVSSHEYTNCCILCRDIDQCENPCKHAVLGDSDEA